MIRFGVLLMLMFSQLEVWAKDLGPSSYDLKSNQKIIAIGDIHGDLDTLKTILKSLSLIDGEDRWIGKDIHLVFVGDLVDRGPQSKEVMDFIMELEGVAPALESHVHTLLGNHELLVTMGAFKYLHRNDLRAFNDWSNASWGISAVRNAYQGNSPYANWIRSRKTMLKIGDTLFVHGGLDSWVFDYSIDEVNTTVNQWIENLQGVSPMPDFETEFLIEGEGPLWNRRFSVEAEDFHSPQDVKSFLDHYGVKRVVVGHTIVPELGHTLSHPLYGDKVLMIDTAISVAYGGLPSALEISQQAVSHYYINRESGKLSKIGERPLGLESSPRACVHSLQ